MKLHEFQAKNIFAEYGITVPRGVVVKTPEEASKATQDFGGSAVIKAQVHAGGRGKAGGVQLVRSSEEAKETALNLLGRNLVTHQTDGDGVPVNSLLVEEITEIQKK